MSGSQGENNHQRWTGLIPELLLTALILHRYNKTSSHTPHPPHPTSLFLAPGKLCSCDYLLQVSLFVCASSECIGRGEKSQWGSGRRMVGGRARYLHMQEKREEKNEAAASEEPRECGQRFTEWQMSIVAKRRKEARAILLHISRQISLSPSFPSTLHPSQAEYIMSVCAAQHGRVWPRRIFHTGGFDLIFYHPSSASDDG